MISPRVYGSREPFRYRGNLLNANRRKSNANLRESNANLRESIDANLRKSNANLRECIDANLRKSNANTREFIEGNSHECLNEDISVNSRAISENSRLFRCGVGETQAAITPFGELKMCLMIDYPKTRINANLRRINANEYSHAISESSRGFALKEAWGKLKELVKNIKPDKDYKCNECELKSYCKWCPGRAWLYNRSFTSCEPESRKWAEGRRQLLNC